MKRKTFLLTIMLLGMQAVFAQMPVQELPFDPDVVKGTLPNGLTYFIQHNENPKERAFFYIAQKVGSLQEEENQRGLAHFLEHMCFNGSEHFPGNSAVSFCQRIGVQFGNHLNAYTACDRTVYNIDNVPTTDPANLDSCLYILYDWAHALTLDPKEIDKERGVIHEEWRVRNSGVNRILERQLPVLMPGSKYSERLPIGLMSVVDNFKPEVLRAYYDKWYRPDLQGIVVVGDIDVKQMEEKIKTIFGQLPAPKQDAAKFEYYAVPDNYTPIFVFDKDKEVTTPTLEMFLKYDPVPRHYRNTFVGITNSFINMVLTTMLNYRLDDIMQDANVPVTACRAYTGPFMFMARTKQTLQMEIRPKDGKSEEAMAMVLRELRRASMHGFAETEYKRALDDLSGVLDQMVESRKTVKSNTLVDECIEYFLENQVKTKFETEVQIYRQLGQNVPVKVINDFATTLIGQLDTNLVVFGFYPEKEGVKVPTAAEANKVLASVKAEQLKPYEVKVIDTKLIEKEPVAGTIKKELPEDGLGYKGFVLSNGITVKYKKTDFDEGKILMNAISHGGQFKLKKEELTNATVFNDVMANNGVGKFNGNDLEKALTGRIVSISPTLTNSTENFSGSSSKKDFKTLFQLNYLYFTEINYDTVNYNKVIKNKEVTLANRDANPMTAFSDSLKLCLYNYAPYVQPMTLSRLKQVNYDGILKIYKERFGNPADFTYVFTGAINEDSLKSYAKQYLASLPTTNKLEKKGKPDMRLMNGKKICRFSKKMETPQCYVVGFWNGTCEVTPQNQVVAEALGQVLDIHYTETIREKHSFAYSTGASSSVMYMFGEPKFLVQVVAPVKPEKCDSTIMLINEGMQLIAKNGVEAEKLNKVKEQMLKEYETNQRENPYWQSAETDFILDGKNTVAGVKEAIKALSSDQIKAFVNNNVLKQNNSLKVIIEPEK